MAVLSTVLVLGAAGPALSASRTTSATADVPCSETRNTLAKYAADHGCSDLSNVNRHGDRVEPTASKAGQPIRLSVDVTSGAVQEHQG